MDLLSEDDVLVIRGRLANTTLAQRAFGSVDPIFPDQLSSAVNRHRPAWVITHTLAIAYPDRINNRI